VTLLPGTYCTDAALTGAGVLTLDGNNATNPVWIFKIGTKGTGALTGTNFSVVMTNGGEPCNVTWWVAQAATMTDSNFIGTILAGAAITMTDGRSTLAGRALAKAAVTMTNATVVGCEVLSNAPFCNGKKHHGKHHGHDKDHKKCNQGVGNGAEGCDPGNSDHASAWPFGSNDENDGNKPGNPGRKGGKKKPCSREAWKRTREGPFSFWCLECRSAAISAPASAPGAVSATPKRELRMCAGAQTCRQSNATLGR
jgi:hypothetical protein